MQDFKYWNTRSFRQKLFVIITLPLEYILTFLVPWIHMNIHVMQHTTFMASRNHVNIHGIKKPCENSMTSRIYINIYGIQKIYEHSWHPEDIWTFMASRKYMNIHGIQKSYEHSWHPEDIWTLMALLTHAAFVGSDDCCDL